VTIVVARTLAGTEGPAHEVIELAFEQRERSRLRATLLSGEEVGIDLPLGTVLRDGDRLALADGRVVAVEAAREALLEVRARDGAQLARIAYHVGNRHVPLQVGDGWLRLLPDHVLRAMIEGLGGRIHELAAPFQPETGAYGHSHVHHAHDDQGHGGRIHAFDARHTEHPARPPHTDHPHPHPHHEHPDRPHSEHEHPRGSGAPGVGGPASRP